MAAFSTLSIDKVQVEFAPEEGPCAPEGGLVPVIDGFHPKLEGIYFQ